MKQGRAGKKLEMGKEKVFWGVVGLLLIIGIGMTLIDYLNYRHIEADKFGQGWSELNKPAMELSKSYLNRELGIRMMIPEDWKVIMGAETERGENAAGLWFVESDSIGKYLKVSMADSDENLTDLTDKREEELKRKGGKMEDLAYVRNEVVDITIVGWSEDLVGGEAVIKREAWGKQDNKVVRIGVAVRETDWLDFKNTINEIFENIEWIK